MARNVLEFLTVRNERNFGLCFVELAKREMMET